jgi:hypothetical protein
MFWEETLSKMDTEPVICPSIIFSDLTIREAGTDKVSLIGSFTQFNAIQFPFVAPPFHVTVLLTNIQGSGQALPVTMRIEAADTGHVVGSMSGLAVIPSTHTRDDIAQVVFGFPPTQFPGPGKYEVVILIKNEPVGKRSLFIRPTSSSTTTQNLENK